MKETVCLRVGSVERPDSVAHFALNALQVLARFFRPVSGETLISRDVARQAIGIGFSIFDREGAECSPVRCLCPEPVSAFMATAALFCPDVANGRYIS